MRQVNKEHWFIRYY